MTDSANPYQHRLSLSDRLAKLSTAQLDQVIFVLGVDRSLLSSKDKPTRERAVELLQWAESRSGCGLDLVEQVMADILSGKDFPQYGLPKTRLDATRQDRNETILIDAVWTEVEDRLRQSLHNAILVRLDMAEDRTQVSRPWDSQLRTAIQKPKNLPPGTHIAEVFDRRDVGGRLLILGAPGSGKTTTMLDLAAVLIQRASSDPEQPIPVIVSLSSWQNAKQNLNDWLVNELRMKYGISPKLGQTWLQGKKLLPLLDGLDELTPVRQEPVVKAINDWLQSGEGPTGLLVCSRLEEYALYETTLGLNAAICLEPLTDKQLQSYLQSFGRQHVWDTLSHDPDLLALMRTPLLLSVTVLAHDDLDPNQWYLKQTTQSRMEYLLDAYVQRQTQLTCQVHTSPSPKGPISKQRNYWLIHLARRLNIFSQSEFLIEGIQPSWLMTKREKFFYYFVLITLIMLVALVVTSFSLDFKSAIGVSLLFTCVSFVSCNPSQIYISEKFYLSKKGILSGLLLGMVTAGASQLCNEQ